MSPILTTQYMDEQLLMDLLTPPPAPQAEYPATDGSGTVLTDISGNGFNGTFGAGLGSGFYPTWTAQGLTFSGAQTVGLPNGALEGAQTIMYFVTPNLNNQSDTAAVLGVLSGSGQMVCGFTPGDRRPGLLAGDVYGSPAFCSGQPIQSGTFSVTICGDGRVYINGVEAPWYDVPAHGFPPYPTFAGVTSARIGLYETGAYAPYQGQLYYLVAWSELLTATEVAIEHNRIAALLQLRGVNLALNTGLTHPLSAVEGDSMTRNYLAAAANQGWPQTTLGLLSGTYNFVNAAIGGSDSADMLARIPQQYGPLLATAPHPRVLILMIGTNENWGPTFANLQAAYGPLKISGWDYIILVTGLPRFATDTPRQTFNTAVLGSVGTSCDAVAAWGGDSVVGAPGASTNPTYYPDTLHPSSANDAIGAGYVHGALVSLGIT